MLDPKKKSVSNMTIAELREICQPPKYKGKQWAMRFFRIFSIYFTKMFIKLGLTARIIAYSRFIMGLIGIALIGFGKYPFVLTGMLIFEFSMFIDLTDGEVFRYRTWKTGKKADVLFGSYIDKTFDHNYRPLLILAAGLGSWIVSSNVIYLILGMFGAFFISEDQIIKLRLFEILVHKQELDYLKEHKKGLNEQWGRYDWLVEPFRINNLLSLYFWFGIFGYLNYFIIGYVPLLFLVLIKSYITEIRKMNCLDREIIKKMYG